MPPQTDVVLSVAYTIMIMLWAIPMGVLTAISPQTDVVLVPFGQAERRKLRSQLIAHEGLRLTVYKGPAGFLTVGVGHNIEADPAPDMLAPQQRKLGASITMAQSSWLLDRDIDRCISETVRAWRWVPGLSVNRQLAFYDLAFNLGVPRLAGFQRLLAAAFVGNWPLAHAELRDSRWANQVQPSRVETIGLLLLDGEEPRT